MRTQRTQQLRLTRIRLTNWRNFASIEVSLEVRAFFVGPNSSGKSNLLDAIKFLSEVAKPGSGGLQAAIDNRGNFSAIRCLQARAISYIEIEVDVGTTEDPAMWNYLIRMNAYKREKFATVLRETVKNAGNIVVDRSRDANDDALEFSQTLLEQVGASKEFRTLAQFFASCRYLHVVPQIVRDRTRARSEGEDPYGGDLLRRIKETPKKTRDPRLKRISDALRIAVPQFGEIELQDDPDGVPHLLASYVHWRLHAHKQSEAHFSDGTLSVHPGTS